MPVCPPALPLLSVWLMSSVEQELSLLFCLYSALHSGSPLCLPVGANTKQDRDKLRLALKSVSSVSGLIKACVSWFIFSICIRWLIKKENISPHESCIFYIVRLAKALIIIIINDNL